MELSEFNKFKEKFENANVDEKIDLYAYTTGLTQTQYKQLLKLFPFQYIDRLEKALEA